MDFVELSNHYLAMPGILFFFLITLAITLAIHFIILFWSLGVGRKQNNSWGESYYRFKKVKEQYYELTFAAASTLLFTGIYFMIEFKWLPLTKEVADFWKEYDDFILLGLLVLSIILINILDGILIPLKKLDATKAGSLRMAGMIYMLVLFAYIKYVYQDDNYDTIILYFLTMLVGRFVYMDASFQSFLQAMKDFVRTIPILFLELAATALFAYYGFGSGYLLTTNGVVFSLFIAHCFVIVEIFIITIISRTLHGIHFLYSRIARIFDRKGNSAFTGSENSALSSEEHSGFSGQDSSALLGEELSDFSDDDNAQSNSEEQKD